LNEGFQENYLNDYQYKIDTTNSKWDKLNIILDDNGNIFSILGYSELVSKSLKIYDHDNYTQINKDSWDTIINGGDIFYFNSRTD
jgi:hypothetical protein